MIVIDKNLLKEIIYIFFNSLSISITIWSCFFYAYIFQDNIIYELHFLYYLSLSFFLVISWRVFMLLFSMLLLENFKNTDEQNHLFINFFIFLFCIWVSLLDIIAVCLWLFIYPKEITGLNSYFIYIFLIALFWDISNRFLLNNNANK